MSSGESAKPSTYEERNPFDISRRPEKEVAAEIAQRMAAWKQARGRSYATRPTTPTSTTEANPAPIAAPVQPVRLPKFAEPVARMPQPANEPQPRPAELPEAAASPVDANAPKAGQRAPLFAAIQRAMPPAPSLKRSSIRPEPQEPSPVDAPDAVSPMATEPETPAGQWSGPEGSAGAMEAAVAPLPRSDAEPAADEALRASTTSPEVQVDHRSAAFEAPDRQAYRVVPEAEVPSVETPAADMRETETAERAASPAEETDRDARRAGSRESPPFVDAPAAERKAKGPTPVMRVLDRGVTYRIEARAPFVPEADAPAAQGPAREPVRADPPAANLQRALARPDPRLADQAVESGGAPAAGTTEAPDGRSRPGGRIELPSIETRIEARRLATLRADPWIAGRRPAFSDIKIEAWDVPSPVSASRAGRPRSGAGWAIGLGALLLIGGITAPAAIWQHGRQQAPNDQDQVAALSPAPEPSTETEPKPATQPAPPEKPEQSASPAAEERNSEGSSPAPVPTRDPDAGAPSAAEKQAKEDTLNAVRDGGELEPAPIVSPPPPSKDASSTAAANPAGKPAAGTEPSAESVAPSGSAMIARPFVPEAARKPTPFRPDSSEPPSSSQASPVQAPAGASVAIGSASEPGGGAPASVALKPGLIAQLKPSPSSSKAPAEPAAKPLEKAPLKRKSPSSQTLDQMFQDLIDTLSAGQPVAAPNNPQAPATRK